MRGHQGKQAIRFSPEIRGSKRLDQELQYFLPSHWSRQILAAGDERFLIVERLKGEEGDMLVRYQLTPWQWQGGAEELSSTKVKEIKAQEAQPNPQGEPK